MDERFCDDYNVILKLHDRSIQKMLRKIDFKELAIALRAADLDVQNKIFRNMSKKTSAMLKEDMEYMGPVRLKDVKEAQKKILSIFCDMDNFVIADYNKENRYLLLEKRHYENNEPKNLITVEKIIEIIDTAYNSEHLILDGWYPNEYDSNNYFFYSDDTAIDSYQYDITEEKLQNAFASFQNHLDKLQKIKKFSIHLRFVKYLDAVTLLFEKGSLSELEIIRSGKFDGLWPSAMEKCHTLTSITIGSYDYDSEIAEFPSWIHNDASLRSLAIYNTKITSIPDWIGDLQLLREISLEKNRALESLPDSIGKLTNLVVLNLSGSPIEKLPDTIASNKWLTIDPYEYVV